MGVVVDDIMNYLTMYIYFITNCYIRPTVKRKNGIKYILALTNIVDRRIGCILISVHNDLRQSLAVNSFHGRVAVNVRIRFSASLTKTVPSLVHVSISLFSRLRLRASHAIVDLVFVKSSLMNTRVPFSLRAPRMIATFTLCVVKRTMTSRGV